MLYGISFRLVSAGATVPAALKKSNRATILGSGCALLSNVVGYSADEYTPWLWIAVSEV